MSATYIFCVVAAPRLPRMTAVPRGLPGMGVVRPLAIDRGLCAIVADAPLARYGEDAVNRGLSDIKWVSRAAVAHEKVVEHFVDAGAVLPMKLFTMFASDERALEHLRGEQPRLTAMAKRVANQHEWGVRVLLDRARAQSSRRAALAGPSRRAALSGPSRSGRAALSGPPSRSGRAALSGPPDQPDGVSYLTQKKAQRDAASELAIHARETVADLFDRLAAKARDARRRTASELPAQGGSLLLDAAFLVPKRRGASFRALAAKEARALAPYGYAVTLTGPWPPYTFVQD